MFDGKAFGEEMVGVVKAYVDRQCAPLIAENKALAERVAELEARELVVDLPDFDEIVARHVANLPEPEPGKPGDSVTLDDVAPLINEAVARAVAEIPPVEAPPAPEPIAPDMDAINETIEQLVSDHVLSIPAPQDGKSVTVEDVQPLVAELVERAVSGIPVPKDGESVDWAEVDRALDAKVRAAMDALPKAKDGIGLAGALKNSEGHLILTMSDGSLCDIGCIDGKNGIPFTLDDFDIEQYQDRRSFKLKFTRGDEMHSFEFALPTPLYRGVFKEAERYEIGDMVTWGGSIYHCDKDTNSKPGTGEDWTLAIKKGRDGKDAK